MRRSAALVAHLARIDTGKPSRVVPLPGHYASVLRLDATTGIAFGTDGVGTKMVVAEQLGRFETIGIDCIAMNVNDLDLRRCRADRARRLHPLPDRRSGAVRRDRRGPAAGRRARRDRDPGRRDRPGRRRRHRPRARRQRDRDRPARRDRHRRRRSRPATRSSACRRSGLHSNGYTLARKVARRRSRSTTTGSAGRSASPARADRDLRAADPRAARTPGVDVRGLAHITGDGLNNLLRLGRGRRLRDRRSAAAAADLRADRRGGGDRRRRDARGLQHGLRVLRDRPRRRPGRGPRAAARATTRRRDGSGTVTDRAGVVDPRLIGGRRRSAASAPREPCLSRFAMSRKLSCRAPKRWQAGVRPKYSG